MKKIGVLLSGCGVYDGSEIHESVSTLIALDELGLEAVCIAPNDTQHHVIDHTKGEEMEPARNMLVEAARIARGAILDLADVKVEDLDGIVIPGGFGGAKNLSTWAFEGPAGTVREDVASFLKALHQAKKPIVALCVAPVILAKVFEGAVTLNMTLGTTEGDSPYDIQGFHDGITSLGAKAEACGLADAVLDEENLIITSPCYMMEATPSQILTGARKACGALLTLL